MQTGVKHRTKRFSSSFCNSEFDTNFPPHSTPCLLYCAVKPDEQVSHSQQKRKGILDHLVIQSN